MGALVEALGSLLLVILTINMTIDANSAPCTTWMKTLWPKLVPWKSMDWSSFTLGSHRRDSYVLNWRGLAYRLSTLMQRIVGLVIDLQSHLATLRQKKVVAENEASGSGYKRTSRHRYLFILFLMLHILCAPLILVFLFMMLMKKSDFPLLFCPFISYKKISLISSSS